MTMQFFVVSKNSLAVIVLNFWTPLQLSRHRLYCYLQQPKFSAGAQGVENRSRASLPVSFGFVPKSSQGLRLDLLRDLQTQEPSNGCKGAHDNLELNIFYACGADSST